jgi:hypothetical protein
LGFGHDETIFINARSRPETQRLYDVAQPIKGATMLQSILNGIYRQFLKNTLAGARLGSWAMLQLLETALVLLSLTVFVTHALEAYREREN